MMKLGCVFAMVVLLHVQIVGGTDPVYCYNRCPMVSNPYDKVNDETLTDVPESISASFTFHQSQ